MRSENLYSQRINYNICTLTGIPFLLLGVGSDWDAGLARPDWEPSLWIQYAAGGFKYLFAGIAAWRTWQVRVSVRSWVLQGFLNVLYPFIYYIGESTLWAFLLKIIMLIVVYWSVWEVSERDLIAVILIIPYILWISFETSLQYAVWMLASPASAAPPSWGTALNK